MRSAHETWDFTQSPRYSEVIRTPANRAETPSRGAALQPHRTAQRPVILGAKSRKTVAESDATQSQGAA